MARIVQNYAVGTASLRHANIVGFIGGLVGNRTDHLFPWNCRRGWPAASGSICAIQKNNILGILS